jgi:predicted NBD/HSP70 family sugar kinase
MTMPRAVRHINEVRILDALYRHGTTTRADLARTLGLMRSTVGNLIVGLIEQGLVTETEVSGSTPGGRTGRPGQLVQLHAGHAAFIGADIGVGHLSVVAIDLLGRPVQSRTVAFEPAFGDVDAAITALARLVSAVLAALPAAQQVPGLCVTVPGLVDHQGVVLRAPLLGWEAVPVQQRLAAQLPWSGLLTSENDANAFAAAELYGRAPQASAEALFVYLDAGVGGGLASQGRLLRGHRGHAGEIGHIHLGEHGFDPHTAVQGSFESYVARRAVLVRYRHHGGTGDSLADLLAALAAGEAAALRTLSEWAWWLGRGLAALTSILDPGRIVLGGPVAALYAPAAQQVLDSMQRHSARPFTAPVVEVSPLGTDACALGGALMLHHAHLSINQRIVYDGMTDAD